MITAAEILQYLNITYTAWVTATSYAKGDYVTQSGTIYQCLIAHTSGTFATDLTNLKWTSSHFAGLAKDYAISRVNKHCNRDFRAGSYTDEFEVLSVTNQYYPKNPVITAVTSVKYFDGDINDWVTIFDTGDSVSTKSKIIDGKLVLVGYVFSPGLLYQVVYTGGLDDELVKGTTKEIAALHYKKSYAGAGGAGLLGLTSRNMGGQGTESAGYDIEGAVQNALKSLDHLRIINI